MLTSGPSAPPSVASNGLPRTESALEILSWVGAFLIVGAYFLTEFGSLERGEAFHGANLLGAITVAAISGYRRVWQPCVINIFWAVVSGGALLAALVR